MYNQNNQPTSGFGQSQWQGQGQGKAAQFGAHEVMEIHEVLTDTIDGINQFQLYRPHVRDQQLSQILERQLDFMQVEYNNLVSLLNQRGMGYAVPYRSPKNVSPQYGLKQPSPEVPNTSMNEMDDRDVASGMLGCAKASACMRMVASLECADSELRSAIVQGAVNCNEQAYETWSYMNQQGYYQVPTMKETTTNTMLNMYQPSTQQNQNAYTNPNSPMNDYLQQ